MTRSTYEIKSISYAVRACTDLADLIAEWSDYWMAKSNVRPKRRCSTQLDPEKSRFVGTLVRCIKDVLVRREDDYPYSDLMMLSQSINTMLASVRALLCKKKLSKHTADDVEAFDLMQSEYKKFASAFLVEKASADTKNRLNSAFRNLCATMFCLSDVFRRRESMIDGKEVEEYYPKVDLGTYAKPFIKFADQNIGLVVYKDQRIGAFYVSRASGAAWDVLRKLLSPAKSSQGWVFIEGNVRNAFGRTRDSESVKDSDVVRLGNYVHAQQRGHTSEHNWRISTEQYEKTEHV